MRIIYCSLEICLPLLFLPALCTLSAPRLVTVLLALPVVEAVLEDPAVAAEVLAGSLLDTVLCAGTFDEPEYPAGEPRSPSPLSPSLFLNLDVSFERLKLLYE